MEIMHMNRIAHDIVAIFVSLPHGLTRLDAPTGKPHAEATRVMIPAEIVAIQFSLGVVGPAKLASPDHESVIAPPPTRGDARRRSGGVEKANCWEHSNWATRSHIHVNLRG